MKKNAYTRRQLYRKRKLSDVEKYNQTKRKTVFQKIIVSEKKQKCCAKMKRIFDHKTRKELTSL